jgi:hypothetical protein
MSGAAGIAETAASAKMMRVAVALLIAATAAAVVLRAQVSTPGRDPTQPIDPGYTQKIQTYTTAPYFSSPLVDYLPASKTVPTPAAVLGDVAGAPGILPYSADVNRYMRMLEKASPRVKVVSIGRSEEGREMIAVAISSEQNIAHLEENRARLAKLADPRLIQMDDDAADQIVNASVPVYYITGALHSGETGAPTALMELAYRLAVDESAYIRDIREHVITLITPVVEVDGRDRVVDVYRWHLAHPGQLSPPVIYWGKYVEHDNNRDAMALTLNLTRSVLATYLGWNAQVLHDLHESYPYMYDDTDERVGSAGVAQRRGHDGVWHARRFHARRSGYLVARVHDVSGRDAQRHQPALRNVRQSGRGHDRARAAAGRNQSHLVPAKSAAGESAVVAARQ